MVDVGAGQWLSLGSSEPSVFRDQHAVNQLPLNLGENPVKSEDMPGLSWVSPFTLGKGYELSEPEML